MELKTNLTDEDYQDLMFINFKTKKPRKFRYIRVSIDTKPIVVNVNGKEHTGIIETHPVDYSLYIDEHKNWIKKIGTNFKIKTTLSLDELKILNQKEVYIDDKKYYVSEMIGYSSDNEHIECEFISYDIFESDEYIEI